MGTRVIKYFTKKRNIAKFLAFVTIFAFSFILVFQPWGSIEWLKSGGTDKYVATTLLVVVMGFVVLLISRIIMYALRNKYTMNLKLYTIWCGVEILGVALLCSLFSWYYEGCIKDYFDILPNTAKYTGFILSIPYLVSWLYIAYKERDEVVDNNTNNEIFVTDNEPKKEVINFLDEKGSLKLSIYLDSLLYIEAADNYVNIYYTNKGKFSKFMLRSTLKNIEERYSDCNLIRCHRSYVVNFSNIAVLRKEKDGLYIDFSCEAAPRIPVSKTYSESVVKLFSQHSL